MTVETMASVADQTAASETPDTPEQTPNFQDFIKQLLSDFVMNLFRGIGRLFGN